MQPYTCLLRYGPADKRTLWMAGINAMLLTGIVSGYAPTSGSFKRVQGPRSPIFPNTKCLGFRNPKGSM